jgi:heme/copper-type cytochrome/quinol oxidase subunit 3
MTKRAQLGMAMLLISETVFFSLLIGAFKYFAATPLLPARNGWLLTSVLLAASLCAWQRWRWAAVALGAAFLIGLFATSWSPLAAIAGLHVVAGMLASAIVPRPAVRAMAFYWCFLTAVFIVIVAL